MPLDETIAIARALHAEHGDALLDDQHLREPLASLREAIARRRVAMEDAGIGGVCATCARDTPGGCCFEGIGESFDALQLLLNLLLGSRIDPIRIDPVSCAFVGPEGCSLAAPQAYCLSFFCPGLRATLGSRLEPLLAVIGLEIQAGCVAEQALGQALRERRLNRRTRGG